MNVRPLLTLAGAVALGALAWRGGGWQGIAVMASALLLWFLLYYTRLLTVMKRAADRPVGYVGSAVMLNAKLKAGQPLLHVVALTRALGQRLSAPDAQPEVYRWTDPGQSHVTAEFAGGRLKAWRLERPPEAAEPPPAA
ncbi:MAG: glycerate kinase [Ottowia sp.]|uniref:glycerate kinase n=1 Tax=Ottowia sp. TaxID=1898956 RepID=UPI0039E5E2BB